MAARRDTPEMFEAFRMAEAERRRRSQETEKSPEVVQQEVPVTPVPDETDQNFGRPPVTGRPDRPWTQTGKGQEPAFYLPLGQRCQLVLSVSYQVAVGLGVALVLALVAAFVFGLLVGGCESVDKPVDQSAEGGLVSDVNPRPRPMPGPVVAPSPVDPTPGPTPPTRSTPVPTPASQVLFKVQVVTVDNNTRGQAELAEMKTTLEGRGYRDIEMRPNAGRSKLFMIVGKFDQDRRTEAAALAARVKNESFKGRFPFREAFVVQTSGD